MSINVNVEYRLLQPDEEEAVLDLWCETFPDTNRKQWRDQFVWDPHRFQRSRIAVDANGTVLSTIRYFVRTLRNQDGDPVAIGWITNVATKPAAQRQGHAGTLLELTLEAMRQEGCRWSLLTADEEAAGFYERYGWLRFPFRYRQGLLASRPLPSRQSYLVSTFDPLVQADGWEKVAAVYAQYNQARPLTVVRDSAYWRGYMTMRFADWQAHAGAQILVATPTTGAGILSGYVVALFSEMGVLVSELCVQPEETEAIPVLFNAICAELVRRNLPQQGRVYLAHEPYVDAAVETFFDATLHEGYDYFLLARTLAGESEEEKLAATLAAPGGIHWLLDEY